MAEGQQDAAITIRVRRVHLWAFVALLVGLAAGFLIGHAAAGSPRPILYGIPPSGATGATGAVAGSSAGPASTSPKSPVAIATADSPGWGPADAKVTVVEFVDYQCPFCGLYARNTYPALKKAYANTIHYVSRHFPLSIHPFAMGAALAAECSYRLGRFWQYHDTLFHNQSALDKPSLVDYAKRVGIDPTAFKKCTSSAATRDRVHRDQVDGAKYGITGTPTIFVNGKPLVGALPLAQFKSAIDAALHH